MTQVGRVGKSEPKIRAAEIGDATAIADVYAPYVLNTPVSFEELPPDAGLIEKRILASIDTHPWLVVEINGNVVGYAYAVKHSTRPGYRWTVDASIYLNSEFCGMGIGRGLYQALVEILRTQGFKSVFAEIVLPNAVSVKLHEAMGFCYIGTHKQIGYKCGQWQDIGYWRLGLTNDSKAPDEPIPFSAFKKSPAFTGIIETI